MDTALSDLVAKLAQWAVDNSRAKLSILGKLAKGDREDILDQVDDLPKGIDDDRLIAEIEKRLASAPPSRTIRSGQPTNRNSKNTVSAPSAPISPWSEVDAALQSAPFRFVALNDKVVLHQGEAQSLADPTGTIDAVIDVDWAVETPLLVGEQAGQTIKPFKIGDRWAIPGSTLRGVLRSTLETIAFARLSQTNRHRRFALRNFDNPYYKDTVMAGNVNAGWLQNVGGKPTITPCDWGYVDIDDLRQGTPLDSKKKGNAIQQWAERTRPQKYGDHGVNWQGANAFKTCQYFGPARTVMGRPARPFAKTAAPGFVPGYLVFSGPVRGEESNKRFDYVFFDKAGAARKDVTPRAWTEFQDNNCKPSANKIVPDGAWAEFKAPTFDKGGRVPVFYVGDLDRQDDPDFSFGLTRLYRLPHRRSIGDVLLKGAPAHRLAEREADKLVHKMDFVEHLFGYVHEPADLTQGHDGAEKAGYTPPEEVSRKGRVAVGFATADHAAFKPWPQVEVPTVLGPPKASFAPFYLAGQDKDWSSDKARLAGRKRYLARETGAAGVHADLKAALDGQMVPGNVSSLLHFMVPGTESSRLTGQLRLHNVTTAELGAVLWVIGLGGDPKARHLVGRAKSLGAGRIRAAKVRLHQRDNATGVRSLTEWVPQDGRDPVKGLLQAFEDTIAARIGLSGADWLKSDQVQGVLEVSRPVVATKPGTTYLPYTVPDEKGQAKKFGLLRKRTGNGTGQSPKGMPDILLPAIPKPKP